MQRAISAMFYVERGDILQKKLSQTGISTECRDDSGLSLAELVRCAVDRNQLIAHEFYKCAVFVNVCDSCPAYI